MILAGGPVVFKLLMSQIQSTTPLVVEHLQKTTQEADPSGLSRRGHGTARKPHQRRD